MRSSLLPLQAEARTLARSGTAPGQKLRIGAGAHLGTVGRARAGSGETFWQYRHHTSDDSVGSIDWRRSARSDDLFVREHELERPRHWLFWFDPSVGFDWSSEHKLPRKSERAMVLIMAMAEVLARSGEQCGSLNGRQRASSTGTAADRLGQRLWARSHEDDFPESLPGQGNIPVLLSDFYADPDSWRQRLRTLATQSRRGLVVAISDPVERDFPFSGRTRLFMPGSGAQSRLFGRIESIRDAYRKTFVHRRSELRDLLSELGWQLIEDCTDRPAHEAFRAMILAHTNIRAA